MREIGPYRVLRAPGTGGAERTHLCRAADGLLVAVEELHPAQAPDAAARRRFARRARAARRIDGPWTLPVLDADPDAERPWLATAHAPAPDLVRLLRATGPLPVATVRRLGAGLARALAAGHAAGVVHGGLEPARVLVTARDPKLTGFGLPPAPGPDGTTGPLGYASPEQIERPADTGPPGDVFALGALLATAAQGRHPWTGRPRPWTADDAAATGGGAGGGAGVGAGGGVGVEEARAVRQRIVDGRPDLADVPGALLPALARCLDPDPALRPTPAQLLVLLDPDPGFDPAPWLPPAGLALTARYAADLPRADEAGPVHLHPLVEHPLVEHPLVEHLLIDQRPAGHPA
ncbi:protein kinase domain-containing protein [Kitasatospora phosalacinea]|uniref:Protein kinase domain-containing protein n=1 Tax=Kitasatospora phosalacinea TaxID=2065 RepID=A0A9W6PPA4_9ACTN|nr:hypothetical protein [Kitasatospora phosalacinea]GLW58508.1 hypothetical protein Kpho01_65190 [Kitasatospora phosalacinea]